MKIEDTSLVGIKLITPDVFHDARGHFLETFHTEKYATAGLDETFVQDNLSHSKKNVLRGLHYQYPNWQGKLVQVIRGEIFDVAVDVRRDSPTFGRWYGTVLSSENRLQLYIAPGFAHGFCALSDTADVLYKCTDFYRPEQEQTLLWNDPAIGIDWPVKDPILSDKDARGQPLSEAFIP